MVKVLSLRKINSTHLLLFIINYDVIKLQF
jgi:hypothetical protein